MRRWTFPPDLSGSLQCQRNHLVNKDLGYFRREQECINTPLKRRARESNPQPVTRHLISSQAANHSRTLRKCLRYNSLRYLLLVVKGCFLLCAQPARKEWCIRILASARSFGRQTPFDCSLGNYHAVHPLVMLPNYLRCRPHHDGGLLF